MASRITITKTIVIVLGGGGGGGGGISGYVGALEAADGARKIMNRHTITVIIIAARATSAASLI